MLTEKSLKIKENFEKDIKEVEKQLLKGFTEEEKQEFLRLIYKMSNNL